MTAIVVFGAGGRAGRRVVAEAVARGHRVTAVVRNPADHPGLASSGAAVLAGDATDAASVAAAAAGHDAAVSTVARLDVPAGDFFVAAARALVAGLEKAGVRRLVAVGIGSALVGADGVRLHDQPGVPEEHRAFSLGHAAEVEALEAAGPAVDWVVLAPPPVILADEAERTGTYEVGTDRALPAGADATFSYADLAVALVDEATTPAHSRGMFAVG
jgi:hypothetical protein